MVAKRLTARRKSDQIRSLRHKYCSYCSLDGREDILDGRLIAGLIASFQEGGNQIELLKSRLTLLDCERGSHHDHAEGEDAKARRGQLASHNGRPRCRETPGKSTMQHTERKLEKFHGVLQDFNFSPTGRSRGFFSSPTARPCR